MKPALAIDALVVHYGGIAAVKSVSLKVHKGKTVCLIGANGAGKTSVMRAISGLLRSKSGSIQHFGEELVGIHAARIASRGLAHVPEGRETFSHLTVEENLRMGGFRLRKAEFAAGCERIYQFFPRLKERRMQYAGLLSGGEQQMLVMGRAIISRPDLILLDEPSMGLAPNMVDEVFSVIRSLQADGVTLLLVEQNALRALEISDYAYVMESGSIVLEGPGSALATDPRVTSAYLGDSEGFHQ